MDYGLLKNRDADNGTGTAEITAGVGVYVVEHGGAVVSTCGKINAQLGVFDLASHGNCAGFIDHFAGVIVRDFNDLGITVDFFVDDHEVSFGCTVTEVRRGVHRDINHAFLHFFVERSDDLVGVGFIPSAFNGTVVIHNAGIGVRCINGIFAGLFTFAGTEEEKDDGNYEKKYNEYSCIAEKIIIVFS